CAWQAGQEGGNSVADVLSGKASPSGKLTMTFPVHFADAASSANFPIDMAANMDISNSGEKKNSLKNVDYTDYEEDIYVGYRYFDTFGKEVSYPFGYGLSYTTFEYAAPRVETTEDAYLVSVQITNTGKRAGKEAVQLYVAAPDRATANKPEKELKAFAKTRELQPGETETLVLKLPKANLASFDTASSAWVVTPGSYDLLLGASSRDIRAKAAVDAAASSVPVGDLLKPQGKLRLLERSGR
ncbi:MAG: fibronectin type III-like domain-contianing protein, partial [Alistipes sp.]|nr:fibronectin type III-like domain-contianing protein [Alistipes sp.]